MIMTSIDARHYATDIAYTVSLQEGRIAALVPLADDTPDLPFFAPGLIDVQVNGYGGQEFNDPQLTTDKVLEICLAMDQDGITHF